MLRMNSTGLSSNVLTRDILMINVVFVGLYWLLLNEAPPLVKET